MDLTLNFVLQRLVVIAVVLIASGLFYKLTKGGSNAWKYFLVAANLFIFFGPVFDFFYTFESVTALRMIRIVVFTIIPSILLSYSFMYLYKDIEQEPKRGSIFNLFLYNSVVLILMTLSGLIIRGFGGLYSVLHIFSPVILLVPALYWSHQLWKESGRICWVVFISGYFIHIIAQLIGFYRTGVCGIGSQLENSSMCAFQNFTLYSLYNFPYNEFWMQISPYPFLYLAISLYSAGFIVLMVSLGLKGRFVPVEDYENTKINRTANQAIEKIGSIVGIPNAHSMASKSIEGTEIEEGVRVGRKRVNITSEGDFDSLKLFLRDFIEESEEAIGSKAQVLILNVLERNSQDNKEIDKVYRELLAEKVINRVIEGLGETIKNPVAYRIASFAIKESELGKSLELGEEKVLVKRSGEDFESVGKFIERFKDKSSDIVGPVGPRLIKEAFDVQRKEHEELENVEIS